MRKLKRLRRALILQSAALKANCSAHPQALSRGAQIVLTGRGVNSALMVGAMMHEFSWDWRDCDKLAQARLAGHIVECGAQGSGGLFTDWDAVPDWDRPVIRITMGA